MGYVRKKPRKTPAQQDETARTEFVEQIKVLRVELGIDLWFCDESGFSGDPVPRRILCLKGSRPTIPYYGSHIRTSAVGAVRPHDGKFVSLVLPYVDTNVFQSFLHELEKNVDKNRRNIVVLDNATWHKTKRLNWGSLEAKYLPSYSPDFNPIEELWLAIKERFFSWFWTKDEAELDKQVEKALKYYIDQPDLVKSICTMSHFH
jgi:transposase